MKKKISSYSDAIQEAKKLVSDYHKEHIICLYLNSRKDLIKAELISIGTLTSVLIHPREIFRPALVNRANSIVLLHNHPSGSPNPTKKDIAITRKLEEGGEILDIELVDHVIFTDKKNYFSFCEEHLL